MATSGSLTRKQNLQSLEIKYLAVYSFEFTSSQKDDFVERLSKANTVVRHRFYERIEQASMARYIQLYVPDLSPTEIKKFKKRKRSLEICIDNKTEEALSLIDCYFFTGGMFHINERPRDVVPRSGSLYFLANTSFFTGVNGGWKFKVVGTDLYLYIGFSNPFLGSYKTFVSLTTDGKLPAKWPYRKLKDRSIKTVKCDEYIAEVTSTDPHYSSFQRIHCKLYYNENNV